MEKYLTSDNMLKFCLVALMLCWAFNMIYTAVQNARKEKEHAREPFIRIDASMNDLRTKIDSNIQNIRVRVESLEHRLSEHDRDLSDLHNGQSAMCRGVQALLDHELHNGNEDEMRAASDNIGKWLRTR